VDRLKSNKAKLNAQSEAHKAEVKDLRKKFAEMSKNFEVAKARQEISEWTSSRLQKNVEELHKSKERCYERSLDCEKKLKDSFAEVGAYSLEKKFIRGDPKGVVEWIGEEVEAFEEILSDRGDFCAFAGARGVAAILEKTGCEHVKSVA
jgi:seryl-tRNA synthetase